MERVPGGDLVHAFAQHPKAVGFDVMEVSPPLNPTGLTERQAASLVLDFAAGRTWVSAISMIPGGQGASS